MSHQKPLVDFNYLAHVCQHDSAFMKEMVMAFIDSIPQYSAELKVAFERDQTKQIDEVAHKLKPLLLYLKLDSLYADIKLLQHMPVKERLEGTGLQKLEATFEAVQAILTELKDFIRTQA